MPSTACWDRLETGFLVLVDHADAVAGELGEGQPSGSTPLIGSREESPMSRLPLAAPLDADVRLPPFHLRRSDFRIALMVGGREFLHQGSTEVEPPMIRRLAIAPAGTARTSVRTRGKRSGFGVPHVKLLLLMSAVGLGYGFGVGERREWQTTRMCGSMRNAR